MPGVAVVVEDNEDLAFGLRINLAAEGLVVRVATTSAEARDLITALAPELVLLDLMLPDGDGLDLLRVVRADGFAGVIIVLSARTEEIDRVAAFRLGADDYVTKPFSVMELIERIKARLRPRVADARHVAIGDARVDLEQQVIYRAGKRLSLTRQECKLLAVLIAKRGVTVKRADVLSEAWGFPQHARTRSPDFFIQSLRKKIEHDPANPAHLITVRGLGFRLE